MVTVRGVPYTIWNVETIGSRAWQTTNHLDPYNLGQNGVFNYRKTP